MTTSLPEVPGEAMRATGYAGNAMLEGRVRDALAAAWPILYAAALTHLLDALLKRDEAGEFGECCANPRCRACTIMQEIDTVARSLTDEWRP